jgi:hypothetical protein
MTMTKTRNGVPESSKVISHRHNSFTLEAHAEGLNSGSALDAAKIACAIDTDGKRPRRPKRRPIPRGEKSHGKHRPSLGMANIW